MQTQSSWLLFFNVVTIKSNIIGILINVMVCKSRSHTSNRYCRLYNAGGCSQVVNCDKATHHSNQTKANQSKQNETKPKKKNKKIKNKINSLMKGNNDDWDLVWKKNLVFWILRRKMSKYKTPSLNLTCYI